MSYMAHMNCYSYALWEQLSDVMDTLTGDKRNKCRFLLKEGMQLGKHLLTSDKNFLDLFAKTVATAVSLC